MQAMVYLIQQRYSISDYKEAVEYHQKCTVPKKE